MITSDEMQITIMLIEFIVVVHSEPTNFYL